MANVARATIRKMLDEILKRQGKAPTASEADRLQSVGFRSLDFAELALRVESAANRPLQFEAGMLRTIETVRDVLDFMEHAAGDGT